MINIPDFPYKNNVGYLKKDLKIQFIWFKTRDYWTKVWMFNKIAILECMILPTLWLWNHDC